MANVTYDQMWQEAMAELNEQVHIEDDTLDLEPGDEAPPRVQVQPLEAFQHYACLYIKYLQIFKKLEACYDSMIHPQKRLDVKVVMNTVMARVIELKLMLVKWNPPNPDVNPPAAKLPAFPFPWEYVNLDDILVDLKLPPETLEVPIPRYFVEDRQTDLKNRDKLVQGYMNLKLGVDLVHVEEEEDLNAAAGDMTLSAAIQIIQRNERGRQGKQRALTAKALREEQKQRRMYDAPSSVVDKDPEAAAANIQKVYRGFASRRRAARTRDEELVFIGMKPAPPERSEELEAALEQARAKRKTEQMENRETYEAALLELQETVMEEEGPEMREKLMQERRNWFTEQLGKGQFPEDLTGYYDMLNAPSEEELAKLAAEEEAKADDKGKKGKGDKGKKDDKKGKGDKGKKGKKGKDDAEPPKEVKPPPLTGPSEFSKATMGVLGQYETTWLDRDETENFAQKHEDELAKTVVRPNVIEDVRKQVDVLLTEQLANFKKQLKDAAGGKKGKKGAKGKGKKGKKGGKGKKGKGPKPLPGAKLCGNMDVDHMLSVLVENRIVNNHRPRKVSDLVGEFNFLGTSYQNTDLPPQRDPLTKNWIPQDPSMAQIRQNLTEYCILPLGAPDVRKQVAKFATENEIKLPNSVMLYGPAGSGKTMLVEAVAHATGALLFNLSPSNLEGKFLDKGGSTKLLHMVFTVAREPAMAPALIYIDEVDKICAGGGGKKKASAEGPARYKKDLATYIASLTPEDSVMVIGCTKTPWLGDEASYRSCFDRFLYIPYPKYGSLVMLWQATLQTILRTHKALLPDEFDVSSLAHISLGYSAGSVVKAIKATLTDRRIERLEKRPLTEAEFIQALCRCPRTYTEDNAMFSAFSDAITGLEAARAAVKAQLSGGGDDDGKKGKKGKGKKK